MLSRKQRSVTLLGAAALLLAACGTASSGADVQPAAAPDSSTVADSSSASAPSATETPSVPASTEPSANDAAAGQEPTDETGDDTQTDITPPAAADEPAANEPAAEAPQPIAGALGGRQFSEALSDGANVETNLLPDLLVDDVTREIKVNLRNVFPAERPVLMWMWAPH